MNAGDEFTGLPLDIILESLGGLLLAMYGVYFFKLQDIAGGVSGTNYLSTTYRQMCLWLPPNTSVPSTVLSKMPSAFQFMLTCCCDFCDVIHRTGLGGVHGLRQHIPLLLSIDGTRDLPDVDVEGPVTSPTF